MKSGWRILVCYIWITFVYGLNKSVSVTKHSIWYSRGKRFSMENVKELTCQKPNVYICEEPFGVISASSTKQCNYRNIWYQEQVYRWVAGRGCLLYTPDFLFAAGFNTINLNAGCLYGQFFAPCLEITKSNGECGCYPFDPALEPVARAMRAAFISAAHGRWERCFYEASDCCSHYMDSGNLDGACETSFDGWTCWPKSKADTVAQEVCSEFVYSNSQPSCEHYSSKTCYSNGSWEIQTDYSSCSITSLLQTRHNFHIAALAVSVSTCLPAVFIFSLYKKLRVGRVVMHRNLLMAIIVRDVLVILTTSEIYLEELTASDDTVIGLNSLACRLLAFSETLAANMAVTCMLVEAIYLHKLVVATFRTKLSILKLYGFGAVITVIPTLIWALVMSLINNHSCWLSYSIESLQWILDVPMIATLLITAGLFIGVMKVLLEKIKNAENLRRLYTTKATLCVLKLFMIHYLMTALRPSSNSCVSNQLYFYIIYCVESLQGIAAAILYCYVNGEVYALLKATYEKTESAVATRMQRSSGQIPEHMTRTTEVVTHPNEKKQEYSAIGSKIHAAEVISIQPSERLAEILDPIYEVVDPGVLSDGYENLEADFINYPSAVRLRNAESQDFYGFTKASSISIECEDWIRCISSPSSSVFNNSLNDYEVKYLEMKFPSQARSNQVLGENSAHAPKKYDLPSDVGNVPFGVNKVENDSDSIVADGSTVGSYNLDYGTDEECIDRDCIVNKILKENIGTENAANLVAEILSQGANEDDNPFY